MGRRTRFWQCFARTKYWSTSAGCIATTRPLQGGNVSIGSIDHSGLGYSGSERYVRSELHFYAGTLTLFVICSPFPNTIFVNYFLAAGTLTSPGLERFITDPNYLNALSHLMPGSFPAVPIAGLGGSQLSNAAWPYGTGVVSHHHKDEISNQFQSSLYLRPPTLPAGHVSIPDWEKMMGSSSQADLLQQGGTYTLIDFQCCKTPINNLFQKILGSSPRLALAWFKPSQVRFFCRPKPQWFTHPVLRPRRKTRNNIKSPQHKKITKLYNCIQWYAVKNCQLGCILFWAVCVFSAFWVIKPIDSSQSYPKDRMSAMVGDTYGLYWSLSLVEILLIYQRFKCLDFRPNLLRFSHSKM